MIFFWSNKVKYFSQVTATFNKNEVKMSQKADFPLKITLVGRLRSNGDIVTVSRIIKVRVVEIDYDLKPKIQKMLIECNKYLKTYVLPGANLSKMALNLLTNLRKVMKVEKSLVDFRLYFLDHDGENEQGELINEQFSYRVKTEFSNILTGEILLTSEIKVQVKNVPEVTRYIARFKDIEPDFYGNVEQAKESILESLKNPLPSYIKTKFKFGDFDTVKSTMQNEFYNLKYELTLINEKDQSTDQNNKVIKAGGLKQIYFFLNSLENNEITIDIVHYPNKQLILKSVAKKIEKFWFWFWHWKSQLKYVKLDYEIDFTDLRKISEEERYKNYAINVKAKIVQIKNSNNIIASINFDLHIRQFIPQL